MASIDILIKMAEEFSEDTSAAGKLAQKQIQRLVNIEALVQVGVLSDNATPSPEQTRILQVAREQVAQIPGKELAGVTQEASVSVNQIKADITQAQSTPEDTAKTAGKTPKNPPTSPLQGPSPQGSRVPPQSTSREVKAGPLSFARTPPKTSRLNAKPFYDVRRQFLAENPGIEGILKAKGFQPVDFIIGNNRAIDAVEAATDGKPFQTTTPFPGTGNTPPPPPAPPPASPSPGDPVRGPAQAELNLKSNELQDLRTPPKTPTSERKIWNEARKIYLQSNPVVGNILKEQGIATVDFINGHPKVIDVVEQNLNAARQTPLSGQNVNVARGQVSGGAPQGSLSPNVTIGDGTATRANPDGVDPNAETARGKKRGFRIKLPFVAGGGSVGAGSLKTVVGAVKNPVATAQAGAEALKAGGGVGGFLKRNITPRRAVALARYTAYGVAIDVASGLVFGRGEYEDLYASDNVVQDRTTFGAGPTGIAEVGENVMLVHKSAISDVEENTRWTRVEEPNIQTGADYVAYIGNPQEFNNRVDFYNSSKVNRSFVIPGDLGGGSGGIYDGTANFNYNTETGNPFFVSANEIEGPGTIAGLRRLELPGFTGFKSEFREGGALAPEGDVGTYEESRAQAEKLIAGGATDFDSPTESGPGGAFTQDPGDGVEGGFQSKPPQAAPLQIDPVIKEILQGFSNIDPQRTEPIDTGSLEDFIVRLQDTVGREPQQYPTLKTPGDITKGEEQGIRGNSLLDNISSAINSDLDERGALQQLAVDLLRSPLGQETARRDKLRDEAENLRLDKQFTENVSASQDTLSAETTSDQTTGNALTSLAQTKATDRRTTSGETELATNAQLQGLRATLDASISAESIKAQDRSSRAQEEKNRIDQEIEIARLVELARQFDRGEITDLTTNIQTNFGQGRTLPGLN